MKGSRAFWDTSSIVPIIVHQPSSKRAKELLRKHSKLVLAWITPIVVHSSLSRLAREGVLDEKHYAIAADRFTQIEKNRIEVFPSETLRVLCIEVLKNHDLRAADSLQLASALIWCNEKPS